MKQQSGTERADAEWVGSLRGDSGLHARDEAYQALGHLLKPGLFLLLHDRRSTLPGLWHMDNPELDELAKDFTQDTLEKVAREHLYNRYRGEAKFTTFMTTVARNVALAELRKKRWRVPLDSSIAGTVEHNEQNIDSLPPLVSADTTGLSPELEALMDSVWQTIRRCVDRLPSRWRQAFIYRVLHELSLVEAKERLGTDSNQVIFNLVHRARQRLKKCLRENDWNPDEVLGLFE